MAGRILNQSLGTKSSDFLLEANTSNSTSAVFNITSTPKRIIAFGLSGGDKIKISRLLLPKGSMKRSANGDYLSETILAEQDYKVGTKAIELNAEQTEVVIDAVGDFRVSHIGDHREEVFVIAEPEPLTFINDTTRGII